MSPSFSAEWRGVPTPFASSGHEKLPRSQDPQTLGEPFYGLLGCTARPQALRGTGLMGSRSLVLLLGQLAMAEDAPKKRTFKKYSYRGCCCAIILEHFWQGSLVISGG